MTGSLNRNGTFDVAATTAERVMHAGRRAGDFDETRSPLTTRTMFPKHWTTEQAVYAAEQAHLAARRAGDAPQPGRPPAGTGLPVGPRPDGHPLTARKAVGIERTGDATYHWLGEYDGVRIEGEVRGGRIVSFRPSTWQDGLDTPAHAPWRPVEGAFSQSTEDHVRYGNRRTLDGAHHVPNPAANLFRGVRVDRPWKTNDNGTYRAGVWYLDPMVHPDSPEARFPGNWHRRDDWRTHTLYPTGWTPAKVEQAVAQAYANRRTQSPPGARPEHWTGLADGVLIEGVSEDGRHLTHRPATVQPHRRWSAADVVAQSPVWMGSLGTTMHIPGSFRHVRFDSGQNGVELALNVHLGGPSDTPNNRAELQRRLDDHLGRAGGEPLVRVRLDFTADPGQALRRRPGLDPVAVIMEADRQAGLRTDPRQAAATRDNGVQTALDVLLPDVLQTAGRDLPAFARFLAAHNPAPLTPVAAVPHAQPLRAPDAPWTGTRPPAATDLAAEFGPRVDRAMPNLAANAGRGMPDTWPPADRRSLAYHLLEDAQLRLARGAEAGATVPAEIVHDFPAHRVTVRQQNGLITDFWATPRPAADGPGAGAHSTLLHTMGREGSQEHLDVQEFGPPGTRVKVSGNGLCLLNAVAVSAPHLVAGPTVAVHELRRTVEHHYRDLAPEDFPAEVLRGLRGQQLGRLGELSERQLLSYVPEGDRSAFAGMSRAELEGVVAQYITDGHSPALPHEREALLRTCPQLAQPVGDERGGDAPGSPGPRPGHPAAADAPRRDPRPRRPRPGGRAAGHPVLRRRQPLRRQQAPGAGRQGAPRGRQPRATGDRPGGAEGAGRGARRGARRGGEPRAPRQARGDRRHGPHDRADRERSGGARQGHRRPRQGHARRPRGDPLLRRRLLRPRHTAAGARRALPGRGVDGPVRRQRLERQHLAARGGPEADLPAPGEDRDRERRRPDGAHRDAGGPSVAVQRRPAGQARERHR